MERAGAARSRRRPPILSSAVCVCLLLVTGCAVQQGPNAMRATWLGYNEAVQNSEQRELLLNLVRLRYTDAPEFLAISGISTQMSFSAGASLSGDFGTAGNSTSAFVTPDVFVGYSETPTISFVPRRDQEFTRQLIAPIELDSLYLLSSYGWGIDRVFRLIVRDLNGLSNQLSRAGTSAAGVQSILRFRDVVSCLRRVEESDLIGIGVQSRRETLSADLSEERVTPEAILKALEAGYRLRYQEDVESYVFTVEQPHYVLFVDIDAWQQSCLSDAADRLRISSDREHYEIDPGSIMSDADGLLSIRTRSLLGAMAYLSNAVDVPEIHKQSGLADENDSAASTVNDILQVRVSASPIDNAFLSVPYRGFWFYIAEDDMTSRRSLGLLTSLARLTIGAGGAQHVPILTLPVSP